MSSGGATPRISVGLVGYGAFGRLIAQHIAPYFDLYAYDPAPSESATPGVRRTDLKTVAGCDIVVLATPVNLLAAVISDISPDLKPGALVMDVGSVKVGPAQTMHDLLPPYVDVIGSHPMFGPQSGRNGIRGLKIALCPIRGDRVWRVAAFMRKCLGLKVFITTPDDHDQEAAMVQGLTHLIAKVLVQMEPLPTRMTTASFDMLMRAVEMVRYDAPEVFLAIERANPYSAEVRERFFSLSAELDETLKGEV